MLIANSSSDNQHSFRVVAFTVNSAGSAAKSAAATEPWPSRLDRTNKVGEGGAGSLGRPPHEQEKLFEVEAQTLQQPPSSAAVGGGGDTPLVEAQQKRPPQAEEEERLRAGQEEEEEGHEKREFLHSVVLLSSDEQADLEGAAERRHNGRQPDDATGLPLHSRGGEGEGEGGGGGGGGGKLPSVPLVGLLVLFFLLYVGIEVGFGAWVAVVVLRDSLAGEAGAALMAR